jgi:class 3 adenylate cyclase
VPSTHLAAILFADLEGFGALVERDEASALELLGRYRSLARPILEEHGAELVDITNDEFLALFDSATGAVQCALHLRLASRLGSRPFSLRIGIHLGDVWRDAGRAIGNGVNIAARVKQAASGGEVLLSEDIWRQVANKLDVEACEIRGLGLKNIERDLMLYRIVDPGEGLCAEPLPPPLAGGASASPPLASAAPASPPASCLPSLQRRHLRLPSRRRPPRL